MNDLSRVRSRLHRRERCSALAHQMSILLRRLMAAMSDQPSLSRRSPPRSISVWKVVGVFLGVLLFFSIISHTTPASAQLFKNVETQVKTIFGSNIDASIIAFMFGMLRIVIWVTAVGFIFFAVYQAQRGEQWQPLMQNAFIVIAAIVIVEGMSKLFFGGATGT